MLLLPIVIASLALTVNAAGAAENAAIRVANGLPQASLVDGRSVAWRYVTLRADTPLVGLEARVPTCIDAPRSASELPIVIPGTMPLGCIGSGGDAARGLGSQQLKARWRAPRVFDGGPGIELTLRTWRPSARVGAGASTRPGSSAEVEVTQPLGDVKAFAGYSAPIGTTAPADDWRTTYGGVKWKPLARHTLEMSLDLAREATTRERDREATLLYSYDRGTNARLQFFLTRLVDDPAARWRSGLGMEWVF